MARHFTSGPPSPTLSEIVTYAMENKHVAYGTGVTQQRLQQLRADAPPLPEGIAEEAAKTLWNDQILHRILVVREALRWLKTNTPKHQMEGFFDQFKEDMVALIDEKKEEEAQGIKSVGYGYWKAYENGPDLHVDLDDFLERANGGKY